MRVLMRAFGTGCIVAAVAIGVVVPFGSTSPAVAHEEPEPTPAPTPAAATVDLGEEDIPAEPTPTPVTSPPAALDAPTSSDLADDLDGPPMEIALFGEMGVLSEPDDEGVPVATGPVPTVTSTVSPAGSAALTTPREFVVTFTNNGDVTLQNARLWHEFMVGVDHTTTYAVACAASGGAVCPDGLPAQSETEPSDAFERVVTFWAISDLPVGASLTFTVTTDSTLTAVCADAAATMLSGGANFSHIDFSNAVASATNSGTATGLTVCPDGPVQMSTSVAAPLVSGAPADVISGDTRVFTATWTNTSGSAITVPLAYRYYVGQAGPNTQATWTCASSGPGTCPAWGVGSSTITHTVDHADPVFGGNHTLQAGQTLTFTIRLTTTVDVCGDDGLLRVQGYAGFGSTYTPPAGTKTSAASEVVLIRCSTRWLLDEDFSGTSVADPAWRGLTEACLTRATAPAANGLGQCTNRVRVPGTAFQMDGEPRGFLKLTDDSGNRVGAALYDRAMPSSAGLILEFTQYQYGDTTTQADGIGFFLADGSYTLNAHGERGGALGYAYTTGDAGANGVPHGYLGVGFDVWGNYGNTNFVANTCTTAQNNGISTSDLVPQAVSLRGPGHERNGYCLVGTQRVADLDPSYRLHAQLPNATPSDAQLRDALLASERRTRVTVHPVAEGETNQRVTVDIDFGQGYFTRVLDRTMTTPAPELIKFGFLGSTGGSRGTHLLNSMRVGTVEKLDELHLAKSIDRRVGTGTDKTTFDVGDVIPYQFIVTNSSNQDGANVPIYQLLINDPLISNVTCPVTEVPAGGQVICTGSYTVTTADRVNGIVLNTATARASSAPVGVRNLEYTDTETAPINPLATDATRVIQPGGTATFQVVKSGTTLGLVTPDDPHKITITLRVPTGGTLNPDGSITVAGQGTWTINAVNGVVFTPINSTYAGVVTPLVYDATNAYGGTDFGTLNVVISTTPLMTCTPAERRASDRYWGFGSTALLNFGVSGTSVTNGSLANVGGQRGVFTVTDAAGQLQFVVDGGTTGGSRIVNRNGVVMPGGSGISTGVTGVQQVVAFPAGPGTGKYLVVSSSATDSSTGRLEWFMVDMTLQGGLGEVTQTHQLVADGAYINASTALTAVPNADGTGYWVLNPEKRGNGIRAYLFDANGPTGTVVTSTYGTASVPASGGFSNTYEDIRFNSDLTRVAALSTNGNNNSGTATRLRLMSFNAATGALTGLANTTLTSASNRGQGFNVEFSPNGNYLFVSRIGSTASVFRYTVSSNTFASGSERRTDSTYRGMVRIGPDGRLYWAQQGRNAVQVLGSPNNTNPTNWTTQNLASGTTSGWGLPQTLVDCGLSPSAFWIDKLDSASAAIAGAVFELYPDDDGQAGPTPVSPGVVTRAGVGAYQVTGLAPGSYWLREIQAPAGHQLLTEDILINVGLRNAVAIDATASDQVSLTFNAVTTLHTVHVTNLRAAALPLAGGAGASWLLWAGGIAFALALGGAVWWRRRVAGAAPLRDPTSGGDPP